jgi:hypothetical protein
MSRRTLCRWGRGSDAFATIPLWLRTGAADPAGPIMHLPTVTVTDSKDLPPPESWRYAAIPGFEVLSNARDATTQRLLKDFQNFSMLIGVVWPQVSAYVGTPRPQTLEPAHALPIPIILCGRGGKFQDFVPPTAASSDATQGLASLFLQDEERSAIVINLEASVLDAATSEDVEAAAASGTTDSAPDGIRVDPFQQFRREYVHSLLAHFDPRPPAWLEEGLVELLMGTKKIDARHIEFARLEDPDTSTPEAIINQLAKNADSAAGESGTFGNAVSAPKEDGDFTSTLQHAGLMGFPDMFAVAHDSPTALNPIGSRWAKQCYAFVHLCLYGYNQKYRPAFYKFTQSLVRQPPSEDLFKQCFGESYKSMLTTLRSYISSASYQAPDFAAKGPGLPDVPPTPLRDASQGEVGRIKGEVLLMAGRRDQADAAVMAAYVRGDRDPRLLEEAGAVEQLEGNEAQARHFLEASTAAKVADPRAYLELARLRLAHDEAKPAGEKGLLSAGQVSDVLTVLFIALRQPPPLPAVYETIAETWSHSAVPATPENVRVLEEGVIRFPRRIDLVYATAMLEAQTGQGAKAAVLAKLGLNDTVGNDAAHARFTALQMSLSSPPPP